jgi:Protein of unknown function (Hypoth_ymh)
MDAIRAIQLLRARLEEIEQLSAGGRDFQEWHQKTDLTLRRVFNDDHKLVKDLQGIPWRPTVSMGGPEPYRRAFAAGQDIAIGLLKGAIYEIEELAEPVNFASAASVDPELWEHVHQLVESEQWAQVASQTAIFDESKVRQWAGLPDSKFGKDLMVAVLKPGAGLFPLGRTAGEREGWLSLGIGITMAVGNADRHRIQKRDDASGMRWACSAPEAC